MNSSTNLQKLSVVVPAYNKDTEVFQSISQMVNQLKSMSYDWEIIVVDDASRDKTLREAVKSKRFNGNSERIKIYSYDLNQGKGFALYYGFTKSQGDTIVFTDSDLDLPATNISTLLSYLTKNSADVAIGSKRHKLSKVNYPFLRKLQSKAYQILIHLLFKLNISDTQVGAKAFRREVLDNTFPRLVVKTFAFDLELMVVASLLGYKKIIEAPITLNYNFSSTIHLQSVIKILQDTIAIYYRKNFLKFYDYDQGSFEKAKSHFAVEKSFV